MKNAVIIGSGQTGHGYVARFLFLKDYHITFIDKDPELVRYMQEDKAYCIHFYSKDRTPVYVTGFDAYLYHTEGAKKAIHEADLILTSAYEQNLDDVALQIKEGIEGREDLVKIMTVENGINPGKKLKGYLEELGVKENYTVSMSACFCSTVKIKETRLDILSMNETYFPYDCDNLDELDFDGAVPVHNFEQLLQRKIWTYNVLAGMITYCGHLKGYEIYGDAANDEEISRMMDDLQRDLNPALQDHFHITKEDQEEFAARALKKMKDRDILDYTFKTGKNAYRKLGPTERIMSPMKILLEHGKDVRLLEFTAAAALFYWEDYAGNGFEPELDKSAYERFLEINKLSADDEIAKDVKKYYDLIKEHRSDLHIYELL